MARVQHSIWRGTHSLRWPGTRAACKEQIPHRNHASLQLYKFSSRRAKWIGKPADAHLAPVVREHVYYSVLRDVSRYCFCTVLVFAWMHQVTCGSYWLHPTRREYPVFYHVKWENGHPEATSSQHQQPSRAAISCSQ